MISARCDNDITNRHKLLLNGPSLPQHIVCCYRSSITATVMFDIPDAKRVRRDDLYASDHEDSPSTLDTSAQDALRAQLVALYGPIETGSPAPKSQLASQPEAEDEEEAFEFNLFAPTMPKSVPAQGDQDGMTIETPRKAQKIILEKDEDANEPLGEGALVRQRRDGWWMADITKARLAEFQDAAVGMDDIRRWTQMRYYGWEKPWKVRVVRTGLSDEEIRGAQKTAALAAKLASTSEAMDLDEKVKSKTKPNKKRRIILRSREKAAKEAIEAARIKAEKDREAKIQDDADYAVKRNARNRERKIKRRERERKKKEALKNGTVFVDEGSGAEEEKNQVEVEV